MSKLNDNVYSIIDEIKVRDDESSLLSHIINWFSTDDLTDCITDYCIDNDLNEYLELDDDDKDDMVNNVFSDLDDLYLDFSDRLNMMSVSECAGRLRDICIDYQGLYSNDIDLSYGEICDFDEKVNKIINEMKKVANSKDEKDDIDLLVNELKENGIL